jgi:dihydrolipoamide dehydrogenase
MKTYDVIVIGSGGGSKITSPAARLGFKVASIEKEALGGTCLNRGCIPSKMLIHPADVVSELQEAAKYDLHFNPHFSVNFEKLITRISNTVDTDSSKIKAGYERNPNIDFYPGTARFVSDKVVEVNGEQLTAEKIIIAVGTRPQIPSIEGLLDTPFMTSTEALRNIKLPKKMIVLGGGYIAVELGYAYGALGTEVHFLVRQKFLRHEDAQVAQEFLKVFSKKFKVHCPALPTRVQYRNGMFEVAYKDAQGAEQLLRADALLVATGIVSNVDTLDLSKTNIKVSDKGFIQVNDYLETSVPGVYALGDCIGRYFFRHSVNFEGEYLFDRVFLKKNINPIQYPPVPHAIFTNPQIAGVGKTEEQLKVEGVDYVVGINSYASSAMGMALLSDHGFCKILIERKSKKILGAHIIGYQASNMIHMIIALMTKQGTLDDLLNMIYIHPALPEIVRNAARKAREALDAPQPTVLTK